jgi:hypothetical protein
LLRRALEADRQLAAWQLEREQSRAALREKLRMGSRTRYESDAGRVAVTEAFGEAVDIGLALEACGDDDHAINWLVRHASLDPDIVKAAIATGELPRAVEAAVRTTPEGTTLRLFEPTSVHPDTRLGRAASADAYLMELLSRGRVNARIGEVLDRLRGHHAKTTTGSDGAAPGGAAIGDERGTD